jgi:hypothetical protein
LPGTVLCSDPTGFTFRFREWLRRSDKAEQKIQADR